MKRALPAVSIVAACLFAGGVSLAKPPGVHDLPIAELPATPRIEQQPLSIDASESVEWLTVSDKPDFGRAMLAVLASQGRCARGLAEEDGTLAGSASVAVIQGTSLVSFVRTERVLPEPNGDASLEITDTWIDPRSHGARRLATHLLPLRRLSSPKGPVSVYGMRVGESVHVIVASPSGATFRNGDGSTGITSCGHTRVALSATEGSGEQAVVQLVPTPTRLALFAPEETAPSAWPLRVTASLSQVSSDPAPLLSVRATRAAAEPLGFGQARPAMPVPAPDNFDE